MPGEIPRQIGRYEIQDRIGQGGMGVLYLALDPAIDRLVAIKVLRTEFEDDDTRERFAGEARAAGRLRHPNIVTIHDVGEQDGRPYIAMEYIPGETLYELIRRRAPLPLSRKLHFIEELCRGLAYAHKAGLIHRDIKPANVMVDPEGVVKILDFGIARAAAASTRVTAVLAGTPSYMSPEQARGHPLDARSDIFSVGLVFYELLAYRQAFPGDAQQAIIHNIIHNAPEPLHTLCPGLNVRIEEIVNKTLQKDPADRYQDLGVMRADIGLTREQVLTTSDQQTVPSFGAARSASHTPARGSDRHGLARRRATQIELQVNAARAALDAGQLEEALEAAEQALMLDPDESRALELVERVRHALDARKVLKWVTDGREHLRVGDLTGAEAALREALAIDSTAVVAVSFQREVQQARREQARLRERQGLAQAALARARESFDAGAFESAIRAATEALAHDASFEAARILRQEAQAAIEERRRQEALASRARHAVELARNQFDAGDEEGAIEALQEFTPRLESVQQALDELRGSQAERARRRAWIADRIASARASLDEQRPREAAALLEEVKAFEPAAEGLEELLDRASVALRALEEMEQRVRAIQSHMAAGTRHLLDGQLDAALERARAALALDPGHDEARDLAATAGQRIESQRRLQHEKRAQRAIEQSRRLAGKGQLDEAIEELRAFSPPHPLVSEALAQAEAESAARQQREREEEERRIQERAQALEVERQRQEALDRDRRASEERRRLEEEKRAIERVKKAEAERQAREAERLEAARLAEEVRRAREARAAEEARQRETARAAEEARQRETARAAEEAHQRETARAAEEARQREIARAAEEARQREIAQAAEEARKAESARLEAEQEEETRRITAEQRKAEAARRAEAARKAEALRLEQARHAAERRAAEQRARDESRTAEIARQADVARRSAERLRRGKEERESEAPSSEAATLPGQRVLTGPAVQEPSIQAAPVAGREAAEVLDRVPPLRKARVLIAAAAAVLALATAGWYFASKSDTTGSGASDTTGAVSDRTTTAPANEKPKDKVETGKVDPGDKTASASTMGPVVQRVRELLGRDDPQALSILAQSLQDHPKDELLTTLFEDVLRTAKAEAVRTRDDLIQQGSQAMSPAQLTRARDALLKVEQQERSGSSIDLVREYWIVRDGMTIALVEALARRDRAAAVNRLEQALARHPASPRLKEGLTKLVDRARADAESARDRAAKDKAASTSPAFRQGLAILKQLKPDKQPSDLTAYWSARDYFDRARTDAPPAPVNTPTVPTPGAATGAAPAGGEGSKPGGAPAGPPVTGVTGDPGSGATPAPPSPAKPPAAPPENSTVGSKPLPAPPPPAPKPDVPQMTLSDDRAQVEEVVRAYARAFTSMDAAAVSRLMATPNERTAREFAQNRSQSLTVAAIDVKFASNDTANVTAQVVLTVEPKVAVRLPTRNRIEFTMRKVNGRWLIAAVR